MAQIIISDLENPRNSNVSIREGIGVTYGLKLPVESIREIMISLVQSIPYLTLHWDLGYAKFTY